MSIAYYTGDKAHLLKAKKMATFRNGSAKLTSSDVQAMDEYLGGRLVPPAGVVSPYGSGTYYPYYRTSQYHPGVWEEILWFQTAINLYPAYGICTTADDTPSAGYYTHTFAVRTSQTPTNQGRHWEREHDTSANAIRWDLLGMMLQHTHIECSEAVPVAVQKNKWSVAEVFGMASADTTDDIASSYQTAEPFHWSHFSFPTFTYNSETIQASIIGWSHDIINTLYWSGLDSNQLYSIGRYIPYTLIFTTLEIAPYNTNVFELVNTRYEDYLTDVDLTVKAARNATNDYVQWAHDKVYLRPFTISADKSMRGPERYLLVLAQGKPGSIVPTAVDDIDDDYYET